MANFCGTARSNYFRVKDVDAFKAWAKKRFLDVVEGDDKNGLFAIFPDGQHTDDGCWPSNDTEAKEGEEEFDVIEELAQHLAEDSVAIIMQAGAEKQRYVDGWAEAINCKSEIVSINLNEIYERAKQLGKDITRAEY